MGAIHSTRQTLLVVGIATIVLLYGCGGVGSRPTTPPSAVGEATTPPSASSSSPSQSVTDVSSAQNLRNAEPAEAGFYPDGTRTGNTKVDTLTEALWSGNTEGLLEQYRDEELPCATRAGLGAPLCPDGTPAGTPVKAYPYAWCDPAFLTDQRELKQYVAAVFHRNPHLFAVYRTAEAPGLDNVAPSYAVVLGSSLVDSSAATIYLDQGGQIVLARWGCGTPDLAVPVGADLVLAPQVTASDEQRSQAEGFLMSTASEEVSGMYAFLSAALGEYDPCAGSPRPCMMETHFPSVLSTLLTRCDGTSPEGLMSSYAYNEQRQGPAVRPYKAACDILRSTAASLGQPAESPEWKESARRARRLLEPALQYLDAQAKK